MKHKSNLIRMFLLTLKLSKKFYIFSLIKAIIMAGKAVLGVYGLALIITQLANGNIIDAMIYAAVIVVAEVILRYLELSLTTYTEIENDKVQNEVTVLISEKLMNVEYKYLEDPTYLDTSDKAKFAVEDFDALNIVMKNSVNLLTYFITICSLITVIILFNPIILIIIFISVTLHFFVSRKANKKQAIMHKNIGPISRRNRYYSGVINDVKYQKDFRMYPISKLIYESFYHYLSETKKIYKKYFNYMGNFEMIYIVINYLQIFAIYSFVAYISITQNLGVGAYILLTASAMRVASTIDQFTNCFIDIKRNIILLKPVFEILDMEDSITISTNGLVCKSLESLEFKNVTFKYPGTDKNVLNDVSFMIKKGDKVSIVGFNGAGKTTIVKLLSRFYTLNQGEILWNGVNINDYNYESYIGQISAVFQDFKLFAYSISKNVDLLESNREHIKNSLCEVGLKEKIESLPNGIDTLLSKEFSENGTDLSGGEKQKVAIARAMCQDTSLAILDEPTSALDPLSEAEIYENFNDLVENKTTIYISHRMSSSKFVDRIIVLENGKVIANDSHDKLVLLKEDLYYKLWSAQANYYI
ncbi:ABC transporter ATP-binding protein [Candidatus Izemoplasma sp. B36]|uniref:ABC transporter ATP-binding protein n=1 Tax=Candidatus Izemoplasma sp. B36 TaxID=3242468 RepID=UPI00355621A7